jgi:ABC-type molybdenum transport system ATPase subunit/photorepair protein PhrA
MSDEGMNSENSPLLQLYHATVYRGQLRIVLGRALVHEPHTLVLDEPITGLDMQTCFQYMRIIQCLSGREAR